MRGIGLLVLAIVLVGGVRAAPGREGLPRLVVDSLVVEGEPLGLRVTGVRAGDTVRVHALRKLVKWVDDHGTWKQEVVTLHAWADLRAEGPVLDVDTATPLAGSYPTSDGRGLLWSGYARGSAALADVAREDLYRLPRARLGTVFLRLDMHGTLADSARVRLLDADPATVFTEVHEDGLDGMFAAPAGAQGLPTVIALHGSEGGSLGSARERAARFAARGFATLALNYFAYPRDQRPGVPTEHVQIPLEQLDRARLWLARQAAADTARIALYGWSKGAEFAEVGAVAFPWVRAAVGCVPTDVVWEGYRGGYGPPVPNAAPGDVGSSWSRGGAPLAFVPLLPPDTTGRYRTNTERYERSRALLSQEAQAAAAIPLETARARVLLLGGEADEVWASGAMTRALARRFAAAGRAGDLVTRTYARAGHGICSTGVWPVRLYGTPGTAPEGVDLTAEGAAAADAWRQTLGFLRRVLGP